MADDPRTNAALLDSVRELECRLDHERRRADQERDLRQKWAAEAVASQEEANELRATHRRAPLGVWLLAVLGLTLLLVSVLYGITLLIDPGLLP